MKEYLIYSLTFLASGNIYCLIELMYRSRTHYSMFFCAGLSVIILLYIYQNNKSINPIVFALIASAVITLLELTFGIVFNIFLDEKVWDYSRTPLNFLGQICVPFSLIWFLFGLIIYYIFKKTALS
ncbi:MAG: hypothetical protein IJR70_01370 [Eubacterium sp.]|nr:hypothetical protein [Eubacterium sp.]